MMTNYDRIKSMSVEEMTLFLNGLTKTIAIKLGVNYIANEKEFIKQWLLQEESDE